VKQRVVIAGLAHGHVQYVFDEVNRLDGVEIVGVSETDPALLHQYRSELVDVPVFAAVEEMLERTTPDVLAATGVYGERGWAVKAALSSGVDVLADKPLCTTVSDLDDIEVLTAGESSLSIMFEKRFYPATLALLPIIDAGDLGEIALIATSGPHKLSRPSRPAWFFDRALYGGIVNDLPVHDIDMTLRLTGAQSGTVAAVTIDSPQGGNFDSACALLLHTSGVAATIDAHWLNPAMAAEHGRYTMRVVGTHGTAEVDWAYDALSVTTNDRKTWTPILPPRMRPAEEYFQSRIDGRVPEVGTSASLLATRIALTAQRSAERGGPVLQW
jgi:predicted dehydrogenase